MSPKNIHFITTYFHPVVAGLEMNSLQTYSFLVERGWKVSAHTTRNTPIQKNAFPKHGEIQGIRINRYSQLFYSSFLFSFRNVNFKNSVIILHDFITFPGLFLFAFTFLLKMLNLKSYTLILSSHGLFNYDPKVYSGLSFKLKRVIDRSIGVFLVNRSVDVIRAVSTTEKNGLVSGGIKSNLVQVVNNGIEKEAFEDIELKSTDDVKAKVRGLGNYILQIGRIDRIKNQSIIVEALQYVKETNQNFVLVGSEYDNQYKLEIAEIAKKLGVEKRLHFLGVVQGYDKYYIIKNAKIVVHMALSEGFCNAVHEAMSQGVPCVVSRDTALEELIKDKVNGLIANSNNAIEIADKINFLNDPANSNLIDIIKNNNIAYTKTHSWEQVSYHVEDLINSAIDKAKA